ncbi:hypothetical protein BDZ91DRAFT_159765 [Kalaharituber pfeilii]|nr:hypothetical protein BDZ91DRAFT_159765 [Kalaharituber pfeilii]
MKWNLTNWPQNRDRRCLSGKQAGTRRGGGRWTSETLSWAEAFVIYLFFDFFSILPFSLLSCKGRSDSIQPGHTVFLGEVIQLNREMYSQMVVKPRGFCSFVRR